MTRAKFTCTEVAKRKHWDPTGVPFLYAAKFTPVTGGSDENKSFFDSSPSGSLELTTMREDLFEPGCSYYLDFTKAE